MKDLNVDMNSLTVEVYKTDRRMKVTRDNPNQERLVEKTDFSDEDYMSLTDKMEAAFPADKGYRFEIFETYVVRTSAVGGNEFVERYDTPYYCSPSSETYWCM